MAVLALAFLTFVLFMYILFMPWIKGEKPDVRVRFTLLTV